jgi:serine/threonine protein kinase
MIGGRKAFEGSSGPSVIAAILERQPPALAPALKLPPRLGDVIRTCLEKNPDDRWQSVRDLRRELTWLRDGSREPERIESPAHRGRRTWILAAAGAATIIALAAIPFLWLLRAQKPSAPPGPPVVVLMDSTHPERIYDEATRKAGGTNADDLTDLLRDLPVVLLKESTNATWHREYEVLQEHPALIVAHRSCFYDATILGDASRQLPFINLSWDKFETFAGLVAVGNPQTRILAYSRGSWESESDRAAWVKQMEQRFPPLRGRIDAMKVPLDRATFRNPVTGAEIRRKIIAALHLQSVS